MNLTAGTRLGRYEIRAKLGEGGMGEVYLAHDAVLGRKLALKILPAEVASNRERMERFVREAKAAASLNHPHIAHIYEIGEADGTHFIAMEFIEGETLRQKIYGQKTPFAALLKYLNQAAEGLAKAHAAGIVHRDLKPDNIMITSDDYAKILDFGLAKLIEGQRPSGFTDSSSEIATAVMPQHSLPGTVMGTVGYMSPEQAQGRVKDVDQRSDIFSFGCILFEAATGRKPFQGTDALDSLHKIVYSPTPQIKEFNATAPDDLQRIVRRCLAKEADKRFQSIKDVAIELEDIRAELKSATDAHLSAVGRSTATSGIEVTQFDQPHSSAVNTSAAPTHSASSAEYIVSQIGRHKKGVAFAVTAVAIILIGGAYLLYRITKRTAPVSTSGLMTTVRLVNNINGNASISPDGKYVVYSTYKDGNASLRYRQVSSASDVEIVALGQNVEVMGTTFSPDSDSVYYVLGSSEYPGQTLFQVPVIGGRPPRKILEHLDSLVSFAPDGKRFVFVRHDRKTEETGIYIGTIDGREPRLIARRNGKDFFEGCPAWSPDGKVIIAPVGTDTGGFQFSLVEIPVEGGPEHAFTKFKSHAGIFRPLWFSDGTGLILNARETPTSPIQIWQVTYPQGVVTRITNELLDYGTSSFGLTADSSTIVTIVNQSTSQIWLANAGEEESRARKVTDGKNDGGDGGLAVLPDGRCVYSVLNGENLEIWIMNADGSGQKQLFSSADRKFGFNVTPDGHYLLYTANRPGESPHIVRLSIDTGEEKQLTFGDAEDYSPLSSSDSLTVYFNSWRSGPFRLWRVSIDGGEPTQVSDLVFQGKYILPGGKLIAGRYFDEQVKPPRSRPALYSPADNRIEKVFDFPKGATNWQPLDEHTLIFTKKEAGVDNIWTQQLDGGPARQLTRFTTLSIPDFVSAPDNKRLAVVRGISSTDLVLIKNFR